MMVLCPWVSYLIAEGLELSGIVAILVNGIFLSYYATPNILNSSKKVLKMGYETVAYSAETLVFIFLGLGLFAFKHPYEETGFCMILFTIINLSIARFLNIWIVSWIVNKFRTEHLITPKLKFVMWLAGLRGAMAYALALKSMLDFKSVGPVILIVTLIYSFISILLVGTIMFPVLGKLEVKN
jgi:sodium/hydrogen exchanger 8